jgi:dTDP-L-rhamnose 4-epimerase
MSTPMRALVTGGAGFIGSHLVDALLADGYEVTVFDSLVPQVHGNTHAAPTYLDANVEFVAGDVRDFDALAGVVRRADVILHHAAAVGPGQSMYDVGRFVSVNSGGTAALCEILAQREHHVSKVLVASSMTVYGEGRYECPADGLLAPRPRPEVQLEARRWEVVCPACGTRLRPLPTEEDKPLQPTSVYATTKRDQEELVLNVCGAYDIPAVAFRYFSVYGPRQALSNPYTGVAAIFASRTLNGKPPLIFEDGLQSRDFVHVSDVVQANLLALRSSAADGEVLNVGTGRSTTMVQLAELIRGQLGRPEVEPEIVGQFRQSDIRHCSADISRISERLGYKPRVPLEEGVADLAAWARDEEPTDLVAKAFTELSDRRLVR